MSDRTPTFFSVDVETTHTDPMRGHLLTVGIVPVVCVNNEWRSPTLTGNDLYLRIDQSAHYDTFFNDLLDRKSTMSWWLRQNDEAQDEAFRDVTLERNDEEWTAAAITYYVNQVEPDFSQRVFVGNPVAFDKAWLDALYSKHPFTQNPFPHRCLCLRSMRFGLRPGNDWSPARPVHDPNIPHHALYDAWAQAQDLIDLLINRENAAGDYA